MTNAAKRKIQRYRSYPVAVMGGIGLYISLSQRGSSRTVGEVMLGAAILLIIYFSLGVVFYNKGSKILQSGKGDYIHDAIPHFEKALKFGVASNGEVAIGTIILQHGDKERGKEILEGLVEDPEAKTSSAAKISLSMYYWMEGNIDEAIRLCLDARDNGSSDRNLYINLCTYYFEKGMEEEFKDAIREAKDKNKFTPALIDLEVGLAIRKKDWDRAAKLTEEVFEKIKPTFLDPFLHKAMVSLHYGDSEAALGAMEDIIGKCSFSNTSIYTRAQIEALIALMEDEETRWGLREALETNPEPFFHREIPEIKKGIPAPEFPKKPNFLVEKERLAEKEEELEALEASDGELSTDLTDDDEEWLRKHQND